MTHVTCRLTTKNRDQLRNPPLGNRVWATFTFLRLNFVRIHTAYYLSLKEEVSLANRLRGAICREARWAGERFDGHARAVLEQYSWSSVVVSY